MKKKQHTIELVVPSLGMKQSFELEHAERILRMGTTFNGGWEIPEDSKYYYSKENGIRVKSDKTNTAKADKTSGN